MVMDEVYLPDDISIVNTAQDSNASTGQWLGNRNEGKWIGELTRLEKKRIGLHNYITMKLEDRDYHAVQDAGSDLRELESRVVTIKEWLDSK
jgi:hypothetical protein